MREKINILCATDDNYAPYTGVLAMSIFCSNEDEQIDMYILIDPSVSEENKNKLRALSSVRHNINLLSISNDIILSQDINPSKDFLRLHILDSLRTKFFQHQYKRCCTWILIWLYVRIYLNYTILI